MRAPRAPHPAIVKGLEADGDTLAVRGWQVDLGSLVALVHTLGAQSKLTRLQLWRGGLGAEAAALLQKLPASLTSLSIEGEDALAPLSACAVDDDGDLRDPLAALARSAPPTRRRSARRSARAPRSPRSRYGATASATTAPPPSSAPSAATRPCSRSAGSNLLTDAAAEALLEATREAAPAEGEGEGTATGEEAPAAAEGEGEGGEAAAAEPAPNRTLTAPTAHPATGSRRRGAPRSRPPKSSRRRSPASTSRGTRACRRAPAPRSRASSVRR